MKPCLIVHGSRSCISFIGQLLLPPAKTFSHKIPARGFLIRKSRFVRLGKVYAANSIWKNVGKLANRSFICDVAMTDLPKSKVRSIGVSNFTIEHVSVTDYLEFSFACLHDINAAVM